MAAVPHLKSNLKSGKLRTSTPFTAQLVLLSVSGVPTVPPPSTTNPAMAYNPTSVEWFGWDTGVTGNTPSWFPLLT